MKLNIFNAVLSPPLRDNSYYIIVGRDGDNYYMLRNNGWKKYIGFYDTTYYDPGTPVTVTNNSVLTVPDSIDINDCIFYTKTGNVSSEFNTCFLGDLAYRDEGLYSLGTNMNLGAYSHSYWIRNFHINDSNNVLIESYNGRWLMYGDIYNDGLSGYSSRYLGKAFKLDKGHKPVTSDWNIMLFEYSTYR